MGAASVPDIPGRLALNMVGDGLRDLLDPRLKVEG
jgi:hypothetical protein